MSVRDWLESRTGLPSRVQEFLDEHIPGGPRWAYVFGSALLFLLLMQLGSGLSLALSYSASTTSAWESVAELQRSGLGSFVRALHAHGATLILIIALVHLMQTALQGAYRSPREVTWWLGLTLLVLLLAFTFTGTLLPWDERGYFATQVALGLAGEVPLVGNAARRVLAGGDQLGNLSLTRFYAVHALLLPLALLSLGALHVGLVRKHGVTPPPGLSGEDKNKRTTFFPVQALYDACFSLAMLLGLVAYAIAKPAGLLGPADASAQMPARPDWVFLPLFQLLKLLPSALEGAVALLIPLVLLGLLAALPFLDKKRRSNETWKDRLPIVGALTAVLAITLVLGLVSKAHDSGDDAFQASMAQATDRAQVAMALGTNGVPPQGALFQVHDQPQMRGERLFQKKCLSCHKVGDAGTRYGPELSGYLSRAWIRGALVHPEEPEYWGKTGIIGMETFESLGEQNLSILVDMLHSLRTVTGGPESIPPAHATALKLFEQHCADCHTLKPNEKSPGPSLVRWGSDPWLRAMINDPSVPFLYGAQNKMPHFGDELEAKEIDDLVAYLRTLEPLAAPKLPKVAKARSKR